MNQYYTRLKFLIENDAEITDIFNRICSYYNTKGRIQDKLSISTLSGSQKKHLQMAFSSDVVRHSYIDLKSFLSSFKDKQRKEWVNKIFDICGIERTFDSEVAAEKILDKSKIISNLSLNFPEISDCADIVRYYKLFDIYKEKQISDAFKVFEFLKNNEDVIDYSQLGTESLGDSNAVKIGTDCFHIVTKILTYNLNSLDIGKRLVNPKDLFEYYNVIANPTAIKVTLYGPFIYLKNGKKFDFIKQLWESGESATLSMDNLKGIDIFEVDDEIDILTCENESPFNALKRKEKKKAVIFTSGYPNYAVKKVLELLKVNREFVYHWGDSDFAGYYIASIINTIIPVQLWRCDIKSLKRKKSKMIKIEEPVKLKKIERFIINNPWFPFRNELLFTMTNGWLEQENW